MYGTAAPCRTPEFPPPTRIGTAQPCRTRARSPNHAPIFANHRVSRFALKRARELRHVRQRPVHAEPVRGMRVGVDAKAERLDSRVRRAGPREAEEEALLGREAVDHRRLRLALQ